jgi:oligopeptide/dipeptide ABC transporter ATP-binding protein
MKQVSKHFNRPISLWGAGSVLEALHEVNLDISEHAVMGILGEPGSGKTTLSRLALRLLDASSGQVLYEGRDVRHMDRAGLQRLRRETQILFHNPLTAFDPHYRMAQSLAEPLLTHTALHGDALTEKLEQLCHLVGIQPDDLERHPNELAPVQLQRLALARALALNPRFVVFDDPLSALPALHQVQLFKLLRSLVQKRRLTALFTARRSTYLTDLCDQVAVLMHGHIVEVLPGAALGGGAARHPYTQYLHTAPPTNEPATPLDPPLALPPAVPAGCAYHTRCPLAQDICTRQRPALNSLDAAHAIACHVSS